MERAGKTLSKLRPSDGISSEALARAAWPEAVGKRLANRALAVGLVRDRLIVEVDDAIWQKQLFHLEGQILKRLREVIGDDLIRQIEFRITIARRPPAMATKAASAPASTDEADQIEDFVLRTVYKQARKKATA
jgi:hypothetical protein